MEESDYTDKSKAMAEAKSEENSETTPEKDTYVMLQGPAHIIAGTDGTIEVAFLDKAGKRKKSISFILEPEKDTGIKVLKVMSLDLLIKCNKEKLESLKKRKGILPEDTLEDYFPEVFHEILETPKNVKMMTSTGPPFN